MRKWLNKHRTTLARRVLRGQPPLAPPDDRPMEREFAITTLSPRVQFYLYLGLGLALALAFSPVILDAWQSEETTLRPLQATFDAVMIVSE